MQCTGQFKRLRKMNYFVDELNEHYVSNINTSRARQK